VVPDVQRVVDTIVSERDRFERFSRSLSAEELARPVPRSTWVVQDFISHLATIDGPVAGWFTSIMAGAAAPTLGADGERWSVDRFNDAAVAARRDRSVEKILAEAARERAAMIEVLDRLSEDDIARTIHFGGDSKRPPSDIVLGRYLQGWARHDVIHVADMLRALPERRSDPLIVAWLAEPAVQTLVANYERAMR
jgi:hypothetical protein